MALGLRCVFFLLQTISRFPSPRLPPEHARHGTIPSVARIRAMLHEAEAGQRERERDVEKVTQSERVARDSIEVKIRSAWKRPPDHDRVAAQLKPCSFEPCARRFPK